MNLKQIRKNLSSDGVALIPKLFKGETLDWVKAAIEFARNNPSVFAEKIETDGKVFFHDYWTYHRNKYIKKILASSLLSNCLNGLVDEGDELRFFHDHILFKSPGASSTPWHQDRPYYLVDGPNNFSVWITPDEVVEDHSLAFIRGSHKFINEYTPVSFNDSKEMGKYEGLRNLKDSDLENLSHDGILTYRMSPGDAIIFHNRTLHRSLASSNNMSRSALSLRFVTSNSWLTYKFVNAAPPFHRMGLKFNERDSCCDKWFPKLESFKEISEA
jgi:ectoine hydroxylase-related dioxygenase (phytanoyl-CoA dioxygenase family)